MSTRIKVWAYMAALFAAGLAAGGCASIKIPLLIPGVGSYGLELDNLTRIIAAILNEELNG